MPRDYDVSNTLPARYADRHLLYQWSVQVPEFEVKFMDRIFRKMRGRKPLRMRGFLRHRPAVP